MSRAQPDQSWPAQPAARRPAPPKPWNYGRSALTERVLARLRASEGQSVSRDDLFAALYPDGASGHQSREYALCKVVGKLRAAGLDVQNVHGRGYALNLLPEFERTGQA